MQRAHHEQPALRARPPGRCHLAGVDSCISRGDGGSNFCRYHHTLSTQKYELLKSRFFWLNILRPATTPTLRGVLYVGNFRGPHVRDKCCIHACMYICMKKSFICILIFIRVGHFFHNLLNIYNILNFIDRVRHFLCK